MPYIKQEDRKKLDPAINELLKKLASEFGYDSDVDGPLNYTVTRILLGGILPDRYRDYVRVLGTLEAVKAEIYRRCVGPYEDTAIKKNGNLKEMEP